MFHGGQQNWSLDPEDAFNGNYYFATTAGNLKNKRHSIISTIACQTNAFDNSKEIGPLDPCLSEGFIRNKNSGVIAYFGCSRNNWGGGTDVRNWSAMKYECAFYSHLTSRYGNRAFGEICAAAKANYITQAVKGSDVEVMRWLQFGLNPIGDPEMPVYTSQPMQFDKTTVNFKQDSLIVSTGPHYGTICVSSHDDSGTSYYKIFNNVNKVILTDYPLNIDICISAPSYKPEQLTVRQAQNITHNKKKTYLGDVVRLGERICPDETQGLVVIEQGQTKVRADKIIICSGVKVGAEATLILDKKNPSNN